MFEIFAVIIDPETGKRERGTGYLREFRVTLEEALSEQIALTAQGLTVQVSAIR